MRLVLDSNAICYKDWLLSRPHFSFLERAIQQGYLTLIIPEIVVEEVKNKYGEVLADRYKKLREIAQDVNSMLDAERIQPEELDIAAASSEYGSLLDTRLGALGAQRPPYADIPHGQVVARVLARRKPFTDSGRGYRDTLIWEAILDKVAHNDEPTFLITNNWKDFCADETGALHPDLCQDLIRKGLRTDTVSVVRSLDEFIEAQVKPLFPTVEEAPGEDAVELFDINHFFLENREELQQQVLRQFRRSSSTAIPPDSLNDVDISFLEDPYRLDLVEAKKLDDTHLYVKYLAVSEVLADFFVDKMTYMMLAEDYGFSIANPDWNEHVAWAQKYVRIPFNIEIVLKADDNYSVESFEISLREHYGDCRSCGEPIMSDSVETCASCGEKLF